MVYHHIPTLRGTAITTDILPLYIHRHTQLSHHVESNHEPSHNEKAVLRQPRLSQFFSASIRPTNSEILPKIGKCQPRDQSQSSGSITQRKD